LDWRIFTGISKEFYSLVLLTSYTVWNGGKQPAVLEERNRLLHKTREKKHPLRAVVLRKSEASEEKRSTLLAIKTEGDELEEERELAQRAEEEQANHGTTAALPHACLVESSSSSSSLLHRPPCVDPHSPLSISCSSWPTAFHSLWIWGIDNR